MKVILCGACGRMGRNVAQLCSERGVTVTAGVDVAPAPMPFPVYPDFSDIREEADAVIDFSPASSVKERLDFCKARNIGIVIAGTAFSDADEALIRAAADVIPVFQTGNLSVGVNLLQMLVKKAAEVLGDGFDAEIIERHHNMKKDAPSGTALMLAKSVNEGFGGSKENVYGRHGLVGARKKKRDRHPRRAGRYHRRRTRGDVRGAGRDRHSLPFGPQPHGLCGGRAPGGGMAHRTARREI